MGPADTKWDFLELISFYTAKETVNQWTRQPTKGNMVSSHASDEGSMSRISKGLILKAPKCNKASD